MKYILILSLLFCSCTQMQTSKDIKLLSSLQETVSQIARSNSKSFLFMEVTHNNKGKTQTIPISGILLDDKGHVGILYLAQSNFISSRVFINDQEYSASYLNGSSRDGFTILKIDDDAPLENLSIAKFGDPTILKNGEFIISVTPTNENFGNQALVNLCSVAGTLEGNRDYIYVNGLSNIRADGAAPIGMPFLNLEGEIIGLFVGNTVIMADTFSKGAYKLLTKLENGKPLDDPSDKPWDGFAYRVINETYSEAMNVPKKAILITRVIDKSPSAKAGLQVGDVVTAIDDKPFTRQGIPILSQARKWLDAEIGRNCKLRYLREGQSYHTELTFIKKPKTNSISIEEVGLTVNDITPQDFYDFALHIQEGVLVRAIEKGSPAATSTYFGRPLISAGDIILEMNNEKISSINDLRKVITEIRQNKQNEVLIKILSGSVYNYVSLNMAIGQKTKKAE